MGASRTKALKGSIQIVTEPLKIRRRGVRQRPNYYIQTHRPRRNSAGGNSPQSASHAMANY
jgi:hypothetical protein